MLRTQLKRTAFRRNKPAVFRKSQIRKCRSKTCRKEFRSWQGEAKCDECRSAARSAKQSKRRKRNTWQGTSPRRGTKVWQEARKRAKRAACELCGRRYPKPVGGLLQASPEAARLMRAGELREHIDHIIPWRAVEMIGGDPHAEENLLSACTRCHGKKKAADNRFMRGDLLGCIEVLKRCGFWQGKVEASLTKFQKR